LMNLPAGVGKHRVWPRQFILFPLRESIHFH
jgi:hypothetical protein